MWVWKPREIIVFGDKSPELALQRKFVRARECVDNFAIVLLGRQSWRWNQWESQVEIKQEWEPIVHDLCPRGQKLSFWEPKRWKHGFRPNSRKCPATVAFAQNKKQESRRENRKKGASLIKVEVWAIPGRQEFRRLALYRTDLENKKLCLSDAFQLQRTIYQESQ